MSLTKVGGDLLKQPLTIGTGVTISSDGINASGIITATSFVGDISQATGAAAGLGTALSQDQSNPLNKIYYTDTVLSIGSTQTVNPPDSSNIAYTQYAEIAVDEGFDLIVEDGDDLIPDILGLSTETAGLLSGAGGRIRADQFTNKAGTGAPSFPNGVNVTGVVTATSFSGNITGDVTGNVTGDLTGNVTSSGISSFSGELNVGAGKSIRLYGATSGYSEIIAAAGSASTTFTLPANGGSASQYLQTDGAGVLSWQTVTSTNTFGFTSLGETATSSGSGSTVSGIPSNATEVIIILSDISCSNTTTPHLLLQLGDGSIDTGNNYRWSISYGGSYQASSAQPHIRLIDTGASGIGNVYSGIIRIFPGTSNIQGHFVTHYHGGTSVWGVFKYTGDTTLDRVSISSASVFDQGKYEVLHNGQS